MFLTISKLALGRAKVYTLAIVFPPPSLPAVPCLRSYLRALSSRRRHARADAPLLFAVLAQERRAMVSRCLNCVIHITHFAGGVLIIGWGDSLVVRASLVVIVSVIFTILHRALYHRLRCLAALSVCRQALEDELQDRVRHQAQSHVS